MYIYIYKKEKGGHGDKGRAIHGVKQREMKESEKDFVSERRRACLDMKKI